MSNTLPLIKIHIYRVPQSFLLPACILRAKSSPSKVQGIRLPVTSPVSRLSFIGMLALLGCTMVVVASLQLFAAKHGVAEVDSHILWLSVACLCQPSLSSLQGAPAARSFKPAA